MTTNAATKTRLARNIDAADRTVAGYRAMLEVAKTHGMEYEIERLTAAVAEFEADLDEQIEAAIAAGFTPEDFE